MLKTDGRHLLFIEMYMYLQMTFLSLAHVIMHCVLGDKPTSRKYHSTVNIISNARTQ